MWPGGLTAHAEPISQPATPDPEVTMHQHPAINAELARLHRQDLLDDADRHRRAPRRPHERRFLRRR
jgi:hypothetical protein